MLIPQKTLIEDLDSWIYSLELELKDSFSTLIFRDFYKLFKLKKILKKYKLLYRSLNKPSPSICLERARDLGLY